MTSFSELKLSGGLLAALAKKGYTKPSPIQAKSIPHILEGRDVFGCAQTGTGKTAAFALPIIQALSAREKSGHPRHVAGLILAPTRELALQISENLHAYGKDSGITHTTIFGGVSQHAQVRALRNGVDIIVATPGRLIDLVGQRHVRLDRITHLVLDEADRMLDMGFIHDIRRLIALLPKKRQTLFFSATASSDIMKLAAGILDNPVKVAVDPVSSTAERVNQSVYHVSREDKRFLLTHVLENTGSSPTLVFTRTKHGADKLAKHLTNSGIRAEALHGNKSQEARERALKGFRDNKVRVLVATDIASRGIDIDKLPYVINFEIPEQAETYVHRIGRTGRAGNEGHALSFCSREELTYLRDIHKLINKHIEVVTAHPYAKQPSNLSSINKPETAQKNKTNENRKSEILQRDERVRLHPTGRRDGSFRSRHRSEKRHS